MGKLGGAGVSADSAGDGAFAADERAAAVAAACGAKEGKAELLYFGHVNHLDSERSC